MNYLLVPHPSHPYLECLPGDEMLAGEGEALELVAGCLENGADRLMIHAENLPPDFYDLRSGVAGDVLQKFANYHLRVAAVLTPALVDQGRFREMVLEANRGSQFRVFYDRETAENWLVSLA